MSPAARRLWCIRAPRLAALALLVVTLLVTVAVPPWSDESVGDLGVRSSFAAAMLDGGLPYRDFAFEYPPLAAPAIALPGLVGTTDEHYRLGSLLVTLAGWCALVLLVGALARRTRGRAAPAMVAVAAAPLLLGAIARLHFDVLPAALLLGALVAILDRREGLGFALLGVGALTKGFPLLAAPVAAAWIAGRGDRRALVRGMLALVTTLAVVGAASLALAAEGALDAVRYQLERPLQVESTPASVLHLLGGLGLEDPTPVPSHRSAGLEHPLAAWLGGLSGLALALVLGGLSLGAWRAGRDRRHGARILVVAALGAVVAFAALGKVLSPQFLIWAVPLLGLAVGWQAWALAGACAVACALTLVEFPFHYLDLLAGDEFAIALVALRNAALLAAVGLAADCVRRGTARGRTLSRRRAGAARSIGLARPARLR